MSFIKNTDDFFEGLSNKFFTNERVKSAVESDLNSLSGSITGEQAARQSDVSGLDSRLDIIEGPSGQEGSIAKALVDAKSYTDQEISALVGSAPEILDTLQELSEALSGDASFAQTIAGQISSLSGAIGSESGAREAAITGLDARLDIIEGPSGQAGSIEKALADAKSYADTGLAGKVDVTVNYDIRPGIYSGGSKSANFQIDFANGPTQKFTLQSNVTVTFANPVAGGIYTLQLVQDGTGSRQITWPQITWANGSAPHLSSAGKVDFIQMWYDGTTYYGDYQLADVTFATTAALSAEASGLDARLDLLEADPTTKSYVDEAISGEQSARAADVSGLDARIDALEADPTTKAYVDGVASGLDARLDSLEADPTTKAYVDGAVSGEQSARQSADQALSGAITGEIAAREAAVSGLDSRIDALEADPTTKAYVDGVASGLDARLDSLEADPVTKAYVDGQASGLDARLDVIEGPSGQAGSIAKALVDAKAYTDQEVSALVNSAPEVLNTLKELADALSGDASFASTIAGQIGSLSGAISTEIGNRQSDVSGLDARLDALEADPTTKSYVDGQVSGLDSRIDSLEFDSVTKAYVDGAISGEQAARVADVSGLDARLDALEADPTTKAYVDGAVSGEQTRAQGVEQSLSGAITGEQAAREAAVSGLDARLDALESDPTTKAYVDGQVSGLDSRIDALEADPVTKAYVDGAISGEQSARQADVSGLDARLDALEADPTTKSYVDGAISGEQSARQADVSGLDARLDSLEADPVTKSYVDGQASGLDARLDVIEGPSGQAGSIAKALVDAKAYTDQEVSALVDSAPEVLNTLKELADALSGDAHFASTVAGQIGSLSGAISSEIGNRQSDVSGLDARLDALEADPTTKAYVDGVASGLDARLDSLEADPTTKAYVDGQVSGLDSRIDALEGVTGMATEAYVDAEVLEQAKFFVSGQVSSFSSNTSIQFGTSMSPGTHFNMMLAMVDCSGGTVTMTLPSASAAGSEGRRLKFKDMGNASMSGYVRVSAQAGQTIDGAAYFDMKAPFESIEVYCDGDEWFIL